MDVRPELVQVAGVGNRMRTTGTSRASRPDRAVSLPVHDEAQLF